MLTSEKLKAKLKDRLTKQKNDFAAKAVHFVKTPLKQGVELAIGPNRHRVDRKSFLVIIDEAPGAYWTHPVSYELHDVETDEVRVIREQYPLEKPSFKGSLVTLHAPDFAPLKRIKKNLKLPADLRKKIKKLGKNICAISYDLLRPCAAHKHALFVAGMDNMPDFHNDFVNMRNVLVERYGYDPGNIVVLMGDGTGYPDLPAGAGTVPSLEAALDAYAPGGGRELGPNDTLFLYTFNHGGWNGANSYLCMHPNWDSYYDYELLPKLNNIHCGNLIVAMNQCHSGGFINDVIGSAGPANIAIMTACLDTQSAYRCASGGNHGYFSVVLYTALNWGFPAAVDPAFPGYVAGPIMAHDLNHDGMISADEAWHFTHDMMFANHFATIGGWETPQWSESPAGAGNNLFWGRPTLEIRDGNPWWESPDVYLHDPAVIPTDATADPANPANWGDNYHPDTQNRVVGRIFNNGCSPCRNITVEFRVTSFGAGGGISLIGTCPVTNIDPGGHAFAWVDWNFPSNLIHRCIMVRADCVASPAQPFGAPIPSDDHQAQRNVDPLYAAPAGYGTKGGAKKTKEAEKIIERTFVVRNALNRPGAFAVSLAKDSAKARAQKTKTGAKGNIKFELPKARASHAATLKPKKTEEIKVRFTVPAQAKPGEKFRFPIEIKRTRPEPEVIGGVTFTLEIAAGRLEGRLKKAREGTVVIQNVKQPGSRYTTSIDKGGKFSFKNIDPGPYRILAQSKKSRIKASVFVKPNALTKITLGEKPRKKAKGR